MRTVPPNAVLMPGVYEFEDICTTSEISLSLNEQYAAGSVTFCVIKVVVHADRAMSFITTWESQWDESTNSYPNKLSDVDNKAMFITDSKGNRYDAIAWGDGASQTITMKDHIKVTGWYTFPPAAKDVNTFIFHDQNLNFQTSLISLNARTDELPPTGLLGLSPFQIDPYILAGWAEIYTADGRLQLTYRLSSGNTCQIEELVRGQPSGSLLPGFYGLVSFNNERYQFHVHQGNEIIIHHIHRLRITLEDGIRFSYSNTDDCYDALINILKTISNPRPR